MRATAPRTWWWARAPRCSCRSRGRGSSSSTRSTISRSSSRTGSGTPRATSRWCAPGMPAPRWCSAARPPRSRPSTTCGAGATAGLSCRVGPAAPPRPASTSSTCVRTALRQRSVRRARRGAGADEGPVRAGASLHQPAWLRAACSCAMPAAGSRTATGATRTSRVPPRGRSAALPSLRRGACARRGVSRVRLEECSPPRAWHRAGGARAGEEESRDCAWPGWTAMRSRRRGSLEALLDQRARWRGRRGRRHPDARQGTSLPERHPRRDSRRRRRVCSASTSAPPSGWPSCCCRSPDGPDAATGPDACCSRPTIRNTPCCGCWCSRGTGKFCAEALEERREAHVCRPSRASPSCGPRPSSARHRSRSCSDAEACASARPHRGVSVLGTGAFPHGAPGRTLPRAACWSTRRRAAALQRFLPGVDRGAGGPAVGAPGSMVRRRRSAGDGVTRPGADSSSHFRGAWSIRRESSVRGSGGSRIPGRVVLRR